MMGGLWRTDGSLAGTSFIQELKPLFHPREPGGGVPLPGIRLPRVCSLSSGERMGRLPGDELLTDSVVRGPSVVDGLAFFAKSAPGCYACELWRSDGSAEGASQLALLSAPLDSSFVLGGTRYFLSNMDLWRTDGTAAGTVHLTSQWPNPAYSTDDVEVVEGFAYFLGSISRPRTTRDYFLWGTDGTTEGTLTLLSSSRAQMSSSSLVSHGRRVFFLANDSEHGSEPWVSDGTVEGTRLLKDIQPGAGSSGEAPCAPPREEGCSSTPKPRSWGTSSG